LRIYVEIVIHIYTMNGYTQYIGLGLFVLYLSALIAAKIYSPFWFHQPVHHIYELYPRWCAKPYIKRPTIPRFGVFCDPEHVYTSYLGRIDENISRLVTHLLQGQYISNETHLFHLSESHLRKILFSSQSVISVYHDFILKEPFYRKTTDKTHIWGCMTSRPVVLYFSQYSTQYIIHYGDFLCVHALYQPKNIIRNIIQTHNYQHRNVLNNSFSGVYLLKKEVDLYPGIVPFIETNTYTFILKQIPIKKLPNYIRFRRLMTKDIDIWRSVYLRMTQQFEICALPELVTTIDWLQNERYHIYILVCKDHRIEHILGVYILEDTLVSWEMENIERKRMMRLIGSMIFDVSAQQEYDPYRLYFFRGFLHIMRDYLTDQTHFGILEVPNISHNCYILTRWKERYELKNETSIGYYLYNMIYPKCPRSPENAIILV
jgi:hypothetical protein